MLTVPLIQEFYEFLMVHIKVQSGLSKLSNKGHYTAAQQTLGFQLKVCQLVSGYLFSRNPVENAGSWTPAD